MSDESTDTSPLHPELEAAQSAFARGDYAKVRELTSRLREIDDPEITRAALELERRISVDPAQLAVLAGCLIFFLWITYKYVFSS